VNIRASGSIKDLDPVRQKLVIYDGSKVPFEDNSFDISYSNSVIEHVGDAGAQARFASEVRRLAPRYFVQTPNKWFFIEPHFICLFIHWLPRRLKRHLVRRCSIWGWVTKPDQQQIDSVLAEIRLLTVPEMRRFFPDAEILRERFLGFTKSIIALKGHQRGKNIEKAVAQDLVQI
jgi:Methyltransferase domain